MLAGVDVSAQRAFLESLESRLAAGEQVEIEVSLSLLAGQQVELGEDELRAASRRAVQLLAAGGDPRRDLDPQGRAVSALAVDLDSPARRTALAEGLAALRDAAAGLPHVSSRLERLRADEDEAWRWFACTLLADEIVE
jgi:hypothetical protein